ncbi:hypothetical protein D3Z53_25800 [Lachnospiraceae bacterium]|jgi:hypothetical protein|nr:hypothetical protein [uncultured Schaedlerella sp.]NBI61308.1 hypothetical protein [Lachnospiraceae bacterium]
MINTKEAIDKIRNAFHGEEVRCAIIEVFTDVDKKILQLRISIIVLFVLLIVNLCSQIIAWKHMNVQIQENIQFLERNNQILKENNSLIIEYLDKIERRETVKN